MTKPTLSPYRGWTIHWDYGYYSAFGPSYDASWEGEEVGWVDNGHSVWARTIPDLHAEIDDFLEEHPEAGDPINASQP